MKNAIWLTGYQVLDELNEDGRDYVERVLEKIKEEHGQ